MIRGVCLEIRHIAPTVNAFYCTAWLRSQLAALTLGKGVVGLQVRPEGEGQQKGPQQAYRQQGSAFFVHGQPSLKPKIQEGIEGAVHQIRRTNRQQQYQRHRFRNGQHGAAGRGVPKALHRLGGQGGGPQQGDDQYDGVAAEVVKALHPGGGQAAETKEGGDLLPGGGEVGGMEEHEAHRQQGEHIQVL